MDSNNNNNSGEQHWKKQESKLAIRQAKLESQEQKHQRNSRINLVASSSAGKAPAQNQPRQQHSQLPPPPPKGSETETEPNNNNNNDDDDDIGALPAGTDPRIQSIANVLNQHSKFKLKQQQAACKKGPPEKKGQQNSSVAGQVVTVPSSRVNRQSQQQLQVSPTENHHNHHHHHLNTTAGEYQNQVDQGNSYLYAYNEFVTSPFGESPNKQQESRAHFSSVPLPPHSTSSLAPPPEVFQNLHPFLKQQQQQQLTQESLIESDEDDALSYILHQHQQQRLEQCDHHQSYHYNYRPRQLAADPLDQSAIEHHLSCSRSSHPRHICGIGTGKGERLSNIAARLKEESQRAFVLNQRNRALDSSQLIESFSNNKPNYNDRALQHREELLLQGPTGSCPELAERSSSPQPGSSSSSEHHIAHNPERLLTSSKGYQQHRLLNQHHPRQRQQLAAGENVGYLSWLFCCLCNLIGYSTTGAGSKRDREARAGRNKRKLQANGAKESILATMYTSSQHQQQLAGLGGQIGAYYASGQQQQQQQQQPEGQQHNLLSSTNHHMHHHHHHLSQQHLGGQQQQQHFPGSSDSSFGSSGAFASTCAMRLSGFFRQCCSKKCLFVSSVMLIVMIFILVIGLSAYLNFLINLNKVSLSPLSGRLKVETQGDQFNEMLLNKTSKEFLAKQQQYETILRGALDRTQSLLKSYPNHLVKLEVYSFKPGSLWIYFRLFINKKTLMLDNQLMKRKSPDEQLDRQFLPRLTQQTLHSGFEQLMSSGFGAIGENEPPTTSGESGRPRSSRSSQKQQQARAEQSQQSVKSFDEQITRLMPIIESIDLQSIQVTPEFDMLQAGSGLSGGSLPAFSDNLRASSQFLTPTTTTPSSVLMATGSGPSEQPVEFELATDNSSGVRPVSTTSGPTTEPTPSGTTDEISVSTRKFTLYGYKENVTRPITSSKPSLEQPQESLFLVNQQQKKPASTTTTSTTTPKPTSPGLQIQTASRELQSRRPDVNNSNVVKLISGQPVTSQNGPGVANVRPSENRTTLFNALPGGRGDQQSSQMVAPYQKVDFASSQPATSSPKSIQELWSSALSKKNVTMKNEAAESAQLQQQQPARRPTVATLNNANPPGQRVSVFSPDVSDTIRAQLLASQRQQASLSPNQVHHIQTTTPSSALSSSQKPKVSPHLRHGGSIISTPPRQPQEELPASSARPQTLTTSSIVLNRDFQSATSSNQEQQQSMSTTTTTTTTSTSGPPLARLQVNQNQTSNQTRSTTTTDREKQTIATRKPSSRVSPNTSSSNGDKQQQRKPAIKKIKKTQPVEVERNSQGSTNVTHSSNVNSKGIRIVDNFLASVESKRAAASAVAAAADQLPGETNPTSRAAKNKTVALERFNFNSDSIAPTTIELIRSTTSSLPTQHEPQIPTTERPVNNRPASGLDSLDAGAVVNLSGQLNRPGTSSFSNQWRPITNLIGIDNNRTSSTTSTTRKPNLSLILGTERLPTTLSAPGSQSPFAMSTAILENQLKPIAPIPRLRNNRPTNTYQVVSSSRASSGGGGNEFESRRVSRMRQNAISSTESTAESASSSFATSSSTTTTTTSSSLSSTSPEPNTRLVDDFVITTDKIEGNTRGSTLLPPLVLSSMHELDPLAQLRAANPVVSLPKRTRGPFAFDTLKSPVVDLFLTTSGSNMMPDVSLDVSARSERSPQTADSKLLLRKKLFLGDEPADLSRPDGIDLLKTSGNVASSLLEIANSDMPVQDDRFGNRRRLSSNRQPRLTGGEEENPHFRCQYYGCKAKGSLSFVCLNYTQLCDDFIDCQDESDELDCVSLLQHDSNSNKLSFSNGAGIIYLNRKGSLAPMCIDYFLQPVGVPGSTNSAHDLEAITLSMARKQQELIRQINTIGQYACSLQSFSRLVSVKINHHSLIDGLDLIKSSKLYHRLSIVSQSERREGEDRGSDPSYGSYRSGSSEHEVEISTSSECPSQRTVFVKCGSFECGQDSFSVMDNGGRQQNNSLTGKKGAGVVINDFPWLVKLYWMGTLSCHGYLIDDLWLISSSECFENRTSLTGSDFSSNNSGWTAEISYEHYGNDDYQSIESNRRSVKEILAYNASSSGSQIPESPIVLAKLEKPVRFSPLNRPICLPLSSNNRTTGLKFEPERSYRDCVTATLSSIAKPPNQNQLSTDLVLSKARVHKSATDCFRSQQNGSPQSMPEQDKSLQDLICVSEQPRNLDEVAKDEQNQTHVLICSTIQGSRTRSRWTVVGVQSKKFTSNLEPNKQLYTSVSSQIDWIIDTMDPKRVFHSTPNRLTTSETCNRFKCSSGECLSYSRICDGLYDCSSQDDEKDCHK